MGHGSPRPDPDPSPSTRVSRRRTSGPNDPPGDAFRFVVLVCHGKQGLQDLRASRVRSGTVGPSVSVPPTPSFCPRLCETM